tara:strand:- start:506 stop:904 length:399 start_codon:yes stop_codon:yes gene_type:complete
VNKIIQKLDVIEEVNSIPIEKNRELIAFSEGSPGQYITNIKYWLDISNELRQKLEIKLTNQIEILKLAKEITDELNIDQQIWFINFQQNKMWEKENDFKTVQILEELRRQLISFVQPRLAWEVALLEINFTN